jgi:ketosteroid isomerase-like protein
VSGDYRGRDAVFGYFGRIAELTEGTFRADPEQLYASDRNVVVVHHATARRNGAALDTHTALVFTVDDGRIARFDAVQVDQDAWDAFFPGER